MLLVIYTCSCTELQELAKLPVLFQHFFEHKAIDEKITFAAYIIHHYNDVPHTDNDEERDNQLPFKSGELLTALSLSPALPVTYNALFKKALQLTTAMKIRINNDHLPPSAYAGKIWQPPKYSVLS